MPRVLVLMPIYNAAPYMRRALDSILAQTFTDFVLLVIDDGSTDASGEVIGSVDDPRVGKAGYRFHETLDPPQTARLGDGQLDQSAIVLESLINKLFASFANKSSDSGQGTGNTAPTDNSNTQQGTKK